MKWGIHFDLANKKLKIAELNRTMADPGFWDDTQMAKKITQELTSLKSIVEEYERLETEYEDVSVLIQIGYEESDQSLIPEIEGAMNQFIEDFEGLKLKTLLSE